MTMDKSLKIRRGRTGNRSVLNRAERIQRLKAAERWKEGDSPLGLAKVRVYKLAVKRKKKKKEEEEGEAAAAGAEAATAEKKPADKKSDRKSDKKSDRKSDKK
jgi:small basic protein (TIGR04137 family)